ncbi:NAD(P)H-hydrate dehydratase [Wenyingzhuangia sp. chi5]|uniref:Bifunctional NAD(P)H-hydrate repair enzyme n=1 Tax=Wenyingzhuangia gilva TaxID=3057677 RepID=A0ABT8VUN7_9FLAO|nr:NAD(P)H-hydrate dehydratase [Wenyingzhuangia sp. chi5]MDO3695671.1 NAD(P)H-hydrate dehydratase [Wenyingzhuangia sp. chi5]
MKIFNAPQIKELDIYTLQEQKITSAQLMERAADKCATWLRNKYPTHTHFTVFCGLGNNGGDGLAIARILLAHQYKVTVYIMKHSPNTSPEFEENLALLKDIITIRTIISEKHIPPIEEHSVIIDAMFGAGINRPIEGICKTLIDKINKLDNPKVAIDIPSGLPCDVENFSKNQTILVADYTLTFEAPKLTFLLPKTAYYVGNWKILSIGLSENYKQTIESEYAYIGAKDILKIIKKREPFSHKGTFGHVEIIGGSYGKIGAVVLATKASLRIGAGLATAYTPNCGMQVLQSTVPESMWTGNLPCEYFLEGNYISTHKTVGIGPGLGIHPKTQTFLNLVIKATKTPMVIDADAINILARNKEWLSEIPENSIVTPHPKEFERLVGTFSNDAEKLKKLRLFASTYKCIVVLKGAHTAIADINGNIYFNSTGNPGMATGGSGDVLTGMITGLLAQKYSPIQAALLGVYLHGLAGDLTIKEIGMPSLMASDLVNYIGKATLHI